MRIGVFGGSFDPVHLGHLWIAEAARESLQLSEVRWIPAAVSPLKRDGPSASGEQRLQMLRLALSGCPQHVVDDRELRRGEISYTVDTIEELSQEFPSAELMLIMGSDSLESVRQWHEPERLFRLVTPAVVQRSGSNEIDFSVMTGIVEPGRIRRLRESVIPMPLIEISSHEMRARVRANHSIRFRTTRSVEAYIKAEGLYVGGEK